MARRQWNNIQPSKISKTLEVSYFETWLADRINTKKNKRWSKISDEKVKEKLDAWLGSNGLTMKPIPPKARVVSLLDRWIDTINGFTDPADFGMKRGVVREKKKSVSIKTGVYVPQDGDRNALGMLIEEDGSLRRGSARTSLFETLAAFYCMVPGDLAFKNITKDMLEKNAGAVRATTSAGRLTVQMCFDSFKEEVFHSCYKQAKAIKQRGLVTPSSVIHLDSGSDIGSVINKAVTKEMRKQNLMFKVDKWSAADLWITNGPIDTKTLFTGNIYHTNQRFKKLLEDKKLIGVSLKEVNKSKSVASFEYTNIKNNREIYSYKVTEIKSLAMKGNVFTNTSIDTTLNNVRGMRFSFMGKDGKVKVSSQPDPSAGGGGGDFFGTAWDYVVDQTKLPMPKVSDVNVFKTKIQTKTPEALKELNDMINKLEPSLNYGMEKMIEDMNQRAKSKGLLKVMDKVIPIYLMHEFIKLKEDDRSKLATEIMLVGPAKSDWSGPYVKVY